MRFTLRRSPVLILISLLLAAPPAIADELRDARKQFRALIGSGQYEEALAAARRALELTEAKKGAESPDAAKVLADIADIYSRMERYDEARAGMARALAVMEASRGSDNPRLAPLLLRAGGIEMRAGEADAAIPLFARALRIREQKHGPDHELLVLSLLNLSKAYYASERIEDAAATVERAAAIQEKTGKISLGGIEPTLTMIAANFYNRGKFEDARRLHDGLLRLVEGEGGAGATLAEGYRRWIEFLYDTFPVEGDERLEFVRFASRESPIFFDLPRFDDTAVIAVWRSVVGGAFDVAFFNNGAAEAEVVLGQGKNQAVLSTEARITAEEAIEFSVAIAPDQVKWGEAGEAENPVGTIDYRRFGYYGKQCFAFARAFSPSRAQLGQTKRLSGYYCHRPGLPLSGQDLTYILSRLGMRDYAEPQPR